MIKQPGRVAYHSKLMARFRIHVAILSLPGIFSFCTQPDLNLRRLQHLNKPNLPPHWYCKNYWLPKWFPPSHINRLTPNDPYMGRTATLTSKRCILYIYSPNVGTEYFKHALYSPFFFSSKCSLFHNANLFGSCIIHILYTGCAKI